MADRKLQLRGKAFPLWLVCFSLCFAIAALTLVPIMLLNGGCFTLSYDFCLQQVPFGIFMNRALKDGGLWHWGIDLGGNLLESFSFYDLGSVFFWPTLLFPPEAFPRLLGWFYILKFAVSGASASLWLRRHLKSATAVLIGAVLYAFSGSQCVNAVFHFQDTFALFPLMLWGLELLLDEGRHGVFAVACGLNILSNPVLYFSSVLFLILYFLIVYAFPAKNFSEALRMTGLCLGEGAIGSLCGGIVLLPTVLSMPGNPRAAELLPVSEWFYDTFYWLWVRFWAFLVPADNMSSYAIGESFNWYSWNGYLPLFGLLFVILYLCKERDSLSRLILVCFGISLVPVLNNGFFAFNANPYARWFFMFDLLLACATARVCEESDRYREKSTPVGMCLIIGIFVLLMAQLGDVHRMGRLALDVGVAIGSVFACLLILEKGQKKERAFALGTVLCSALLFAVTVIDYSEDYLTQPPIDREETLANHSAMCVAALTELPASLEKDVLPYRYHFNEPYTTTLWNYSMVEDLPSINSFTSSPHNAVSEFSALMGEEKRTVRSPINDIDGKNQLLGARYIVSCRDSSTGYPPEEYPLLKTVTNSNGQVFDLLEDKSAVPIGGLLYTSYMTREDFSLVPDKEKAHVMANVMVIQPEDEALVGALTYAPYDEAAEYGLHYGIRAESLDFHGGTDCFDTVSVFPADGYAFFSVPYDGHWHCSVNGAETRPLNVNGLMAVPVTAGENTVAFVYDYSPVRRVSLLCSALGVLLCGILLLSNRKKSFR